MIAGMSDLPVSVSDKKATDIPFLEHIDGFFCRKEILNVYNLVTAISCFVCLGVLAS